MVTVGFSIIFIGVIIVVAIVVLIALFAGKNKNDDSSDSGKLL